MGIFRSDAPGVGERVVVRRLIGNVTSDVIGHVLKVGDPLVVRPQAAGGFPSFVDAIEIPADQIQVIKRLSPRRVRNSEIRSIERATAMAFPGLEHRWTSDGQWLLRAGDGITERSNSATPLGASAAFHPVPWDEINEFYAEHGLPVVVHLPERIAPRIPLDQFTLGPEIVVMTRPLEDLALGDLTPPDFDFEISATADADWLALYHFRGQPLPHKALRLLQAEIDGEMGFGRLLHGDRTVAITRGTITDGYLGYSAVEVDPAFRRRGLGTALGAHMLRWGASKGAHTAYLQVISTNTAGIGLYHKLGFIEHHRHRYAQQTSYTS